MPVTQHRRVEDVVTQRPPPQIVACGFPARRSSELGAQLGIGRQPCIGDRALRPYQGKALFELLELLPDHCAVLTSSTEGLPPELLGASGDAQETLDISRYAVIVVVAAPGRMEGVLLFGHGSVEHVSDTPLDGLCRSLEARALSPPFPLEVSLPIACAVVREAQEAQGLWASLPLLGGVSLGTAATRAYTRLFGCQFQPKGLQPLLQQLLDTERIGSVWQAEYTIVQRADPRGVARPLFSSLLFHP